MACDTCSHHGCNLNSSWKTKAIASGRCRGKVTGDDAGAPQLGEKGDCHVEITRVEACTMITNTSDDYARRGEGLQAMPLYV